MRALLLREVAPMSEGASPLEEGDVPVPEPAPGEVRVRVATCGVCHTELDEIEGRTPPPRLPVVPGHQVAGRVDAVGHAVRRHRIGDRVGVAWIWSSCRECEACRRGEENLCPHFRGTGRDAHGGYAEFLTVPEDGAFALPDTHDDVEVAPLLCAGAIGWRSLRLARLRPGRRLGLTGFGASGHLVLRMALARDPDLEVSVFARDPDARAFATELGAAWTGDTGEEPPHPLDAIIDTTPAWRPLVAALEALAPGGRLVVNAIRKEDGDREALRDLDWERHLWMEKELKSVANVTRRDVAEVLAHAAEHDLRPETRAVPLEEANAALVALKRGGLRGATVLRVREERA